MPDAALGKKEIVVQSAVAAAGYPTPAVRASGDASSSLGRAYIVMDRAPGSPLLAGLDGIDALARAPSLARRVPDQLARSLAALHAVDASAVREQLAGTCGIVSNLNGLLGALCQGAHACGRADLGSAATRLAQRTCTMAADVICHGDLHPFNVLVDDTGAVTVLDWTAAILAPRAYDVAFTSLLLAEPPVELPKQLRPVARGVGRRLAARLVDSYRRAASVTIDPRALKLLQAVVCLRALVEVAFWVEDGTVAERTGHPWLTNCRVFAGRLSRATGTEVRAK
jgi:aminoglycoside phosphotransferase (APT) family kinase protein